MYTKENEHDTVLALALTRSEYMLKRINNERTNILPSDSQCQTDSDTPPSLKVSPPSLGEENAADR